MITGIFYPDEGTILLNGKKFNPDEDAARIGYMPEERGLYKKMKIGEQAIYLARLKGLVHIRSHCSGSKTGSPVLKCKPGGIKKLKI